MLKTFDVLLDVEKELHHVSMPAFNISQSDLDSVEITFHINQDDAAFDLTDKTIQLAVKKPSGLTVYQNCEIVDAVNGETKLILTNQAYIEYGIYTGEIMISDADQMIVTGAFYYGVRTAILNDETIESTNDWSALENALFNMDKKPLLVEGVPTTAPEYIGQTALDTLGRRAFIAYDLTLTGWQLLAAGEGGGGIVYWNDILGKPLTFAPAAHGHTIAEVSGLQAELDSKADAGEVGGSHLESVYRSSLNIGVAPASGYFSTDATTGATWVRFSDLNNAGIDFSGVLKSQKVGNIIHCQEAANSLNYARYEVTGAPIDGGTYWQLPIRGIETSGTGIAGKTDVLFLFMIGSAAGAPAEHTHEITEVTGLQAALDGKADNADLAAYAPLNHVHNFADIANKPTTYTPTAHTHGIADVTGLQAALNGKADDADLAAKADLSHTHTVANITDFAAGVAANIPAAYLTQTEGDAAYQPKGTYLTAIPPEYLTASEGDAAYQPIGTYLTAVPTEYLTQTEGDARYAIKGEGGTGVAAAWGDIAGTLANQTDLQAALDAKQDEGAAPAAHTHTIADVTGLQTELDSKLETLPAHTHTAANITDFAAGVAAAIPAAYLTQTEGDAAYQPKGTYLTTIPAEYLTETEGDARYMAAGAAPTAHTHTAAQITDFATAVSANIPAAYLTQTEGDAAYQAKNTVAAHTHTAANITDFGTAVTAAIPAEYLTQTEGDARYMATGAAPAAHTHAWADITGEPTTLAGYGITDAAAATHTHTFASLTTKPTTLAGYGITDAAGAAHTHTFASLTTKPTTLAGYGITDAAGAAHTHTVANITDFAAGVAANIPAEYLTETEGNALYAKTVNVYSKTAVDTALAGKSDTGHTHTVANITDFAAGVAANIPAAYMTDTETAAAYQPIGTYLTAVPLASAAAVGGGRVGNGLGMTGEYLHVKTGAGLGINATNFALQVQTVNTTPAPLNFWTGDAATYAGLTKDPNTLYFITG